MKKLLYIASVFFFLPNAQVLALDEAVDCIYERARYNFFIEQVYKENSEYSSKTCRDKKELFLEKLKLCETKKISKEHILIAQEKIQFHKEEILEPVNEILKDCSYNDSLSNPKNLAQSAEETGKTLGIAATGIVLYPVGAALFVTIMTISGVVEIASSPFKDKETKDAKNN